MSKIVYKVISTAEHKEYFNTRKEAEKYIKQQQKDNTFAEFRIYEVGTTK